ncbi:3-hydroxyacyl-CoA dehydrogenase NAD-binding domain-containing protein [Aliiroseovarius sp. KMU-50]|uniref:3-hydroxyacyl-CoA dehydrogenase NAD-binding domain-containing protein n=1 Tax=Aliiroseovarius salicola TaxID=3009082 RepID=A0ABT4W113_9RHOB|nr:3-hydroxyacyl-CoA dehydrogenase NAD-binding domain-containing protein [Aliiroseovarius sp. KMU-50]MDA5094208.1 3-hydroxyacyl-CoA dehydrogenase NAD-binding domain-containing protein [Aliiroseovarius sp. KMU-50]
MSLAVSLEFENSVAVVTINNPPVNALSHSVRQGLWDYLEQIERNSDIKAVILRAEGRTFPAGADVREFGRPRTPPILSKICDRIEALPTPVIAEIHGTALGGGFELALACHYRIADQTARMGLPEVGLGVLPGGGGTQRLPRLVGAAQALDMIIGGKPVSAPAAEALGLIDRAVKKNLHQAALASALNLIDHGAGPRPTRDRVDGLSNVAKYNSEVAAMRTRHAKSPLANIPRIINCVEAAVLLPFEAGIAMERQAFDECETGPQAEALRHAFFAERRAAKVPELKGAELREIHRIGVVGAGTMGSGIAIACLDAGFPVTLVERNVEGLQAGISKIEKNYERSVKKGRIDETTRQNRMEQLNGTTEMQDLGQVDLVIEAVFEDEEVKRGVFAQLDQVMRPGAILATNTSYLDINALADTISRPEDVVGYHFFSPAHIMKLLEIVVGAKTHKDVVATGFALAKKLRKVPVRAGVADGFIGNRVLASYRLAADFMLEEGASPAEIDAAMRDFGFPVGPYQVLDMAGLDISWARRKRLAETRDPKERYVAIGDRICEQGWFGQKTGRGYYIYGGESGPVENPDVLTIIAQERAAKDITPRAFSVEEIQMRCLSAMANEGARLVEEGVALRPSDVDVAKLYGYGFPRHRGGPMMWADQNGLLAVENALKSYQPEEPEFWKPSPIFAELIKNGRHFSDLNGA